MTFLEGINKDVMPFIAPNAPKKYKKIIPSRLLKRLGEFDPERWTAILNRLRVDLLINEHEHEMAVIGEFDEERDYILIQITDTKNKDLPFLLLQTLLHEMIHVGQSFDEPNTYNKPVDEGDDEFLNYLSLTGEIDAFGHCLFLETTQGKKVKDCFTTNLYKDTKTKVQLKLLSKYRSWKKLYQSIV